MGNPFCLCNNSHLSTRKDGFFVLRLSLFSSLLPEFLLPCSLSFTVLPVGSWTLGGGGQNLLPPCEDRQDLNDHPKGEQPWSYKQSWTTNTDGQTFLSCRRTNSRASGPPFVSSALCATYYEDSTPAKSAGKTASLFPTLPASLPLAIVLSVNFAPPTHLPVFYSEHYFDLACRSHACKVFLSHAPPPSYLPRSLFFSLHFVNLFMQGCYELVVVSRRILTEISKWINGDPDRNTPDSRVRRISYFPIRPWHLAFLGASLAEQQHPRIK